VQPVDGNDIKLPTDGYQSANMLQQVFGNQEQNGKSGEERPKPKAAPDNQSAVPPKVGDLDEPALLPTEPKGESKNKRGRKAKGSDAAPGFSLN
jgi:pilus assembly protein CpaC